MTVNSARTVGASESSNQKLSEGQNRPRQEVLKALSEAFHQVNKAPSIVAARRSCWKRLGLLGLQRNRCPTALEVACSNNAGRFGHFFQPWREQGRAFDQGEDLALLRKKRATKRAEAVHQQKLAVILAATLSQSSSLEAIELASSLGPDCKASPSSASCDALCNRTASATFEHLSKNGHLQKASMRESREEVDLAKHLQAHRNEKEVSSSQGASGPANEGLEKDVEGAAGGGLAKVCPSMPLNLTVGRRLITVVTTASLPWLTGTAVNPLLRAIAIEQHHNALVTLMVPWLDLPDQKKLYPVGVYFDTPAEQEAHIRDWVQERLHVQPKFRILFYPAFFDEFKCGIFARSSVDFTEIVPEAEADVVVLEEPEHLSWHHFGHRWKRRFRLVIGVAHTNYQEYLRRQAGKAVPILIPVMWLVNVLLVRAHCHKVLRLSRGVQYFASSEVCNVHGVGDHFLRIGEEGWENKAAASSSFESAEQVEAPRSSSRCYFIGRMIWGKGWHELLHLLLDHKEKLPALSKPTPQRKASRLRQLLVSLLSLLSLRTQTGRRLKWLADGSRALQELKGVQGSANALQRASFELSRSSMERLGSCSGVGLRSKEGGSGGDSSCTGGCVGEMGAAVAGVGTKKECAGGELWVDCYGSGPHEDEVQSFAEEHKLPCTFFGRKEHGDPLLYKYKVYVNPAVSDVICTATAEALAMGKIAVIADHPSNEFFVQNFSENCITFPVTDSEAFAAAMREALGREPHPLKKEQRHLLTWEAATERFMMAAGL